MNTMPENDPDADGSAHDESEDGCTSWSDSQNLNASDIDSDAPVNHGDDSDEDVEDPSFPQFNRLPADVRLCVWEHYCPELTAPLRILEFDVAWKHGSMASLDNSMVFDGWSLKGSTRRIRKLLAVSGESRALVERALPDTICFSGHPQTLRSLYPKMAAGSHPVITGTVRYRKETDIILLQSPIDDIDGFLRDDPDQGMFSVTGFADTVHNLGVDLAGYMASDSRRWVPLLKRNFPALRILFHSINCRSFPPRYMKWCLPHRAHHYTHTSISNYRGPPRVFRILYCWPTAETAAKGKIPRRITKRIRPLEELAAKRSWKFLPIANFDVNGKTGVYNNIVNEAETARASRLKRGVRSRRIVTSEDEMSSSTVGNSELEEYG